MQNKLLLSVFFILTTLWTLPVHAACTTPAGVSGELEYNTTTNEYEFCNGTSWVTFNTTDAEACAATAEMEYSTTNGKYRFCNGTNIKEIECDNGGIGGNGSIPTNGLVGHWKLDETSGTTAADSSGNGNDGTMSGGLDATNDSIAGQIDTAIDFDGTNDYIDLAATSGDILRNVTAATGAGWVYVNSLGGQDIIAVSKGGAGATISSRFAVELRSSGEVRVGGRSADGDTYRNYNTSSTPITTGTWIHVAGVVDYTNDTVDVYINGVLDGSNASAGFSQVTTANTTSPSVAIGAEDDGSNTFDGIIDNVLLYDRALTSDEISQIYNQTGTVGLVGHWKLDETSGSSIADSTGNGHTGTWDDNSGNSVAEETTTGQITTAINFDGSDDYISVADHNDLDLTSDLTISAWVNADSLSTGSSENRIFLKGTGTHATGLYTLEIDDGLLRFMLHGNSPGGTGCPGGVTCAAGATTLTAGNWYHLVATYDGTTMRVYVNGAEDGNTTITSTGTANASPIIIGGRNSGADMLDGTIDDVRLYDRALTAGEISQLYDSTGLSYGLIGHWKLDETSGTTSVDSGSWANDGTMGGGLDATNDATDGKILSGLQFDGTDDRVLMPNTGEYDFVPITVSSWIKINAYHPTSYVGLFQSHHDSCTPTCRSWRLTLQGGYEANMTWHTQSNFNAVVSDNVLNLDQWYHLVGTVDAGQNIRLYVDGVLQADTAQGSGAISVGANGDVELGREGSGQYFDGIIDDARIYDRVLSQDEITALYRLGKYCPNPVVFDGSTYADAPSLTGVSDSKLVSASVWVRTAATPGTDMAIAGVSGPDFGILLQGGDQKLRILGKDSGGTTILDMNSTSAINDGMWHHILVSVDMANSANRHLYIDGVDALAGTPTTHTNSNLDFTEAFGVGRGATNYSGEMADLWVDFGNYIDFSVLANRELFYDNGPVYLGRTGAIPTGTEPAVFVSGDTATWHSNDGDGGGFSETGTLTDGAYSICDNTCPLTSTPCTKEGAIDVIGGELAVCDGFEYIRLVE